MYDSQSNFKLFGNRELPAVGEKITALVLDSDVVIYAGHFPSNTRDHEFRIAANIELTLQPGDLKFVVEFEPFSTRDFVSEHLTELAKIIGKTVVHARPYMTGELEILLEVGTVLRVLPLDRFEAWAYTSESLLLACPPTGFEALSRDE